MRLTELRELAERATPGPWEWWNRDGSRWSPVRDTDNPWRLSSDIEGGVLDFRYRDILLFDDARYIAACSPEVIKALVAVAEAADDLVSGLMPLRREYTQAGPLRRSLDALKAVLA